MAGLENISSLELSNSGNTTNNYTNLTASFKSNFTLNQTASCTDVTGRTRKNTTEVSNQPPFIVKTCDQILYIPAQAIENYEDCGDRKEAFFTMNMFMVNYLAKNDSSTLKRSILIEDMGSLPQFVPGTGRKCLDFVDSKNNGRFAICYNNAQLTETLFNSFMNFMKCRMGDNLKPLTLAQLKRVYELTCQGKPIDPRTVFNDKKDEGKEKIKEAFKFGGLNPYYDLSPPGSKIETPQGQGNQLPNQNQGNQAQNQAPLLK